VKREGEWERGREKKYFTSEYVELKNKHKKQSCQEVNVKSLYD